MAEYGLQKPSQIASVASAVVGLHQCGDKFVDDHDGALRRLPVSLCYGCRRQRQQLISQVEDLASIQVQPECRRQSPNPSRLPRIEDSAPTDSAPPSERAQALGGERGLIRSH